MGLIEKSKESAKYTKLLIGNNWTQEDQSNFEDVIAEAERLRKIVNEVNNWAVCFCIATPEDMAQNFPRIVEITSPDFEE